MNDASAGISRRWLLTGLFTDIRRAERAHKVCVRRGYEPGGPASTGAGLVGLLGSWGVPDERIRSYEDAIRAGGTLLVVEVNQDADARSISKSWKTLGGREVHRRSQERPIDTVSSPSRD